MSVRLQTVARLTTVQKVCNSSMFLRVLICYGEAVGKMRELVGQVVGMVLFSVGYFGWIRFVHILLFFTNTFLVSFTCFRR